MNAAACKMTRDAVHPATVRAPLSAFRWVPDNDMEPKRLAVVTLNAPAEDGETLGETMRDTQMAGGESEAGAGRGTAPRGRAAVSLAASDNTLTVATEAPGGISTRPVSSFKGVGVVVRRGDGEPVFNLTLVHENPRLSIPLSSSTEVAAVAREWQAWGKALNLPLLAVNEDGSVHAELNALGVMLTEKPSPRRRGSALVGRRSRYGRHRRATALARPC